MATIADHGGPASASASAANRTAATTSAADLPRPDTTASTDAPRLSASRRLSANSVALDTSLKSLPTQSTASQSRSSARNRSTTRPTSSSVRPAEVSAWTSAYVTPCGPAARPYRSRISSTSGSGPSPTIGRKKPSRSVRPASTSIMPSAITDLPVSGSSAATYRVLTTTGPDRGQPDGCRRLSPTILSALATSPETLHGRPAPERPGRS